MTIYSNTAISNSTVSFEEFIPANNDNFGSYYFGSGNHGKFEIRDDGFYRVDNNKEKYLSQPFKVLGYVTDKNDFNPSVLIEFVGNNNKTVSFNLNQSEILSGGDSFLAKLKNHGFDFDLNAKADLRTAFFSMKSYNSVCSISNNGWNDRNAYFLNGENLHSNSNQSLIWAGEQEESNRIVGTSESWHDSNGLACQHSHMIAFGVCAALSAPLLRLHNKDGFCLHYYGSSSTGKSLALGIITSVYGTKIRSWNATSNGLEGIASSSNDAIVTLDELGQVAAKDAYNIAYGLPNGQGKQRANKLGDARTIKEWKLILFSSGEITLEQKISEDGKNIKAKAGQAVRFVELPADNLNGFGIFDSIPNQFTSSHEFADYLKRNLDLHQGALIRDMIKAIFDFHDVDFESLLCSSRKKFSEMFQGYGSQVARVIDHFAFVAAVGEFAIRHGVLKLETKKALEAAVFCCEKWLSNMPNSSFELKESLTAIVSYIQKFGDSGFKDGDDKLDSNHKSLQSSGITKTIDDDIYYCFNSETFKNTVLKGMNSKVAINYLKTTKVDGSNQNETKYLAHDPTRDTKVVNRNRYFCINSKILEIDLDKI